MSRMIMIADHDNESRAVYCSFLEREGFQTACFDTCDALLEACQKSLPALVILDIAMPGTDGFSCCSILRSSYPGLAIILTSSKDNPYDSITALSLGSDDYIGKPFLPLELVMRVRAVLRRYDRRDPAEQLPEKLTFGPLTLYPSRRMSTLNDEPVSLAPTEFDFLSYMMRQPGYSSSREDLLKNLWQVDWQTDTRAVDHLVKRLRKKFNEQNCPVRIETVWGYGFRLTLNENEGE